LIISTTFEIKVVLPIPGMPVTIIASYIIAIPYSVKVFIKTF
jgi:hypothetical protein